MKVVKNVERLTKDEKTKVYLVIGEKVVDYKLYKELEEKYKRLQEKYRKLLKECGK